MDEFLPRYDIVERNAIDIHVPLRAVYEAVHALDMSGSVVIRTLFRLRGLPPTLDGLLRLGVILLGARPPEEMVLGLIARPWKLTGGLLRLDAGGFRGFNRPGYAKIAWNFALAEWPGEVTHVTTEMRVQCMDVPSFYRLRRAWLLVGPFSRFIRREILQAIKRKAEPPLAV